MTRTSHITTRLVGLSTLALGGALLLAGCAGSPDVEQSVAVTYINAGETVDVSIDVPQLECSEVVGRNMFTADADGDRTNGRDVLAHAPGTGPEESYSFSLALGDGLWFVSTNAFTAADGTIELADLDGIVSPVEYSSDGGSDFGTTIDTAATASGTLECTTTD